jgi:hypothetical protein
MRGVIHLSLGTLLSLALAAPALASSLVPAQGSGLLLGTADARGSKPAPVLASDVHIEIAGVVARVRLTQIFRNPSQQPLEAVYAFPLPSGAAVDGLSLAIGKRAVRARVMEKVEGEEAGRQALAAGRRTAVLAREEPELFTVAVGAIPPGEEVAVVLDLQQMVTVEGGRFTLRFPMVAPAGSAERAGREESAPRRKAAGAGASGNSGNTLVNPFDLHVDLYPGVRLGRIVSSSHSVLVTEKAGPHYVVTLERAASADRDFVLTWEPIAGVAAQAALYTQEQAGERYVLLMVIPPAGEPGISGVSVQWDDAEAETWPRSLPDLQPGKALVVAARVSKEASLAVISGQSGRIGKTPWQVVLPLGSAAPGQAIDKLWARLQVAALTSGPRDERAMEAARPAITDLGLRYGLVTEYTSLVAEDTVEPSTDAANAANHLPLRAWVPLAEPAEVVPAAAAAGAPGASRRLVLASVLPVVPVVPVVPAATAARPTVAKISIRARSTTPRAQVLRRQQRLQRRQYRQSRQYRHRRYHRLHRRRHHRARARVAVLPTAPVTQLSKPRGRRSPAKSSEG